MILASATATSLSQSLTIGDTSRYHVRATDGAGNTSATPTGRPSSRALCSRVSSAVSYGGTWKKAYATSYSGGSVNWAEEAGLEDDCRAGVEVFLELV